MAQALRDPYYYVENVDLLFHLHEHHMHDFLLAFVDDQFLLLAVPSQFLGQ